MRRWIAWILVLVLVILGGLALSRWVTAQVDEETQKNPLRAAQNESATPVAPIISETRVFDPNLDPQGRESLSEKLAIETRKTADRAAGEVNPAPKDKLPPAPTAESQLFANSTPPSGIFNGSEGMVKPEEAQINNHWQGMIDGQSMMVMAGSEPLDTSKGLVIVLSSDGFSLTGFLRIAAPAGMSSLKVVEAAKTTLVLEDLNRTRVTFDLVSQAFIP